MKIEWKGFLISDDRIVQAFKQKICIHKETKIWKITNY